MKLFSCRHKKEGREIPRAIVSVWYTMIDYGDGPKFRTCGIALALPAPFFGEYCSLVHGPICSSTHGAVYSGWRLPRLMLRLGFALAKLSKPRVHAGFDCMAIGKQELVATREECEDGLKVSKFYKRCNHKGEVYVPAD